MEQKALWYLAKFLELAGMIVVLVGLALGIGYGFSEAGGGLTSMKYEGLGLTAGAVLFAGGWLIERGIGSR